MFFKAFGDSDMQPGLTTIDLSETGVPEFSPGAGLRHFSP